MPGNSQPPNALPEALAERVGRFCREYGRDGQLRELMAEAGSEDLLDRTVALLAADALDPTAATAALEAIEEVLAGLGLHALTSPNRAWRPLPGVRAPAPDLSAWVCPARRCLRVELTAASCELTGAPLAVLPIPP